MKAEVLKDFLARLGFEVDEPGLQKFTGGLATASRRAFGLAVTVQAAALAVHAAVYKLAADQAKLLDLADATSVAVAELEELGYVATITGADQDKLNSSIQNLQKTMAETTLGGGSGLEAFRRLGIDVRGANGQLRDTVDVLFEVGDRIKTMSSGKRAMFLSQLGIDQSLVRMLTEDVSGLRDTYQQMYAASGMDAQQAAEQSRAYAGEVKTLTATLGLLTKSAAMSVMGKMSEDIVQLRKAIQDNFKKISQVIQSLLKLLFRLVGAVSAIVLRIGGWIGNLVDWFSRLDAGTQQVILSAFGLLAAWRLLNLGFLATPLGMIISGLIAIVALVDDFMTYMEGGQALFDWGPWAGTIMEVVRAFAPLLDVLGQVWGMVKGPLFASFQWWGNYVATLIGDIARVLASFVLAVVRLFQGDLDGAIQAVIDLINQLLGLVNDALSVVGDLAGGAWDAVKGWLGGKGNEQTPGGAAKDAPVNRDTWDAVKDWFGGKGNEQPRPALVPSPAAAAAVTNTTEVNSSTLIQVDGSRNPEATARAVGREQIRVNADLVRHAKGAAS
ncbi:hypothetical protein [Pseudodesulfovibrio sp.]|uniref:hypothetical protein n=1 Tax=Pseudodesulfovibrio sp. TaxID=2035812 RepID=UPI0026375F61|nr:hypothetical protein [Pseudodesulfovibrio sp.]MDD3310949.1 hypothetical protein [Pseudodesulfovibrio sp.]